MQMKIKLLLLACVTLMISFAASANNGTGDESVKKSEIVGGIFNSETKKPISNVSVTAYSVSKKEKTVVSNQKGQFSFDELKGGTYKVVFEKDGYKKVIKEKVVVRTDEPIQLDIEMEEHVAFDFMPGPFNFSDFE